MRQSTIALVLLTVAVGVGLFLIKYRVQSLEAELQALNRDIAQDREVIHVLKAEWSHFNDPERLRTLAGRHLDMMPIQSEQVFESDRVNEKLFKRPVFEEEEEVMESRENAGKERRQ